MVARSSGDGNGMAQIRLRLESRSEEETMVWAGRLAQTAQPGLVIALHGDLGAGKSVFARGFIRGLGVLDEPIPSPTFTLMNPYPKGRIPVYHFDLYRLDGPEDLWAIGADEYLGGSGIALVEWPERGAGMFPDDLLTVRLHSLAESDRSLELSACAGTGARVLHEFKGRFCA